MCTLTLVPSWPLRLAGTPDYAPPERLREGYSMITAARAQAWDVWTMGIMVWNVFTRTGLMSHRRMENWKQQSLPSIQKQINTVLARENAVPTEWLPAIKAALRANWKERPTIRAWRRLLPTVSYAALPPQIRHGIACRLGVIAHATQKCLKRMFAGKGEDLKDPLQLLLTDDMFRKYYFVGR